MTAGECLQILRSIKDVSFATVDAKGRPQVRMIDVMLLSQEKLYFCTARGKDFYQQLMASRQVAVTGMNTEYQMIRLNGSVRKLPEQKEWIDRIFAENPVMKGVYPGDSRYILEPFCIETGQVEFFDLGKEPIVRKSFSIGGVLPEPKGFYITNSCIQCAECRRVCPQQCIDEAAPYVIRQENCLHCGLCLETCPAGAIVKRRT